MRVPAADEPYIVKLAFRGKHTAYHYDGLY